MQTRGLSWPQDFAERFASDTPVRDYLAGIIDRIENPEVEILDIGAGPATVIGKVHPRKKLTITATDALGRKYGELLDELGLKPSVRTRYAEVEKLREQVGERQFHIVHASNSLDHSADPFVGIQEMLALTRPGGFVVLLHEENEGVNERYYALHKWDFRCEDGRFTISGPGPRGPTRDVTEMVAESAQVDCSLYQGEVLVVMHKLSNPTRAT